MRPTIICCALLAAALAARADETPFSYVYAADSLPKGHWEYEQWHTLRSGKAQGSYAALDLRSELEHGFTDRLQASLYVNSSYLYARGVYSPDDPAANLPDQSNFNVNGVSVELKYQVLCPYKDPLGLALYLEPELGVRDALTGSDTIERALEGKLILQEDFCDDQLVLASNIVFEPEWEVLDGAHSKELKNEYSLGASYRFAPL